MKFNYDRLQQAFNELSCSGFLDARNALEAVEAWVETQNSGITIDTPCLYCGSKEVVDQRLAEQERKHQDAAAKFKVAADKMLADQVQTRRIIEQMRRTIEQMRADASAAARVQGLEDQVAAVRQEVVAERRLKDQALTELRNAQAEIERLKGRPAPAESESLADGTAKRFGSLEID